MNAEQFLDCVVKKNKKGYEELQKDLVTFKDPKNFILFSVAFTNLAKYYNHTYQSNNELEIQPDITITYISNWTNLELARAYFVLKITKKFEKESIEIIDKLFELGDNAELIALYKSLSLLPYEEKFLFRASEAIRSNMTPIFEAIALNNPYPMKFFNQAAWNQMILKVFFLEINIKKVIGLKKRANKALASMLVDFINEKQSAKKAIDPDIWNIIELCNGSSTLY